MARERDARWDRAFGEWPNRPGDVRRGPVGWWDRDDRAEFGRLCSAVGDRFGDIRRWVRFRRRWHTLPTGRSKGSFARARWHPGIRSPASIWSDRLAARSLTSMASPGPTTAIPSSPQTAMHTRHS